MRWSLAWMILASIVCALGCRNRATPLSNPFLAPDRVPPPATRNLVPGTAVPYYNDSQQVAPAVSEPLSMTFQPSRSEIIPAGGVKASNGADRVVLPRGAESAGGTNRIAIPADNQSARFAAESRHVPPVSNPRTAGMQDAIALSLEPRVLRASPRAVEIGELPLANAPGTPRRRSQGPSFRTPRIESGDQDWSRTAHSDGAVLQSSYMEEEGSPRERSHRGIQLLQTAADATPRTWARYGFEPDYRLLRGRLEESAVTGQWKLRYIPIDGATDEFGGSVVIENPQLLHAYQPGDFVEIRGVMDRRPIDGLSFAARYRVASIRRLAE